MSTEAETSLVKEVRDKLDGLSQTFNEAELEKRIKTAIDGLLVDDAFVRKIRFDGGDPRLTGSKFARFGLSVGDIEFLHGIMSSNARKGGAGPSPELENAFTALTKGQYRTVVGSKAADIRQIEEAYNSGRINTAGFKEAMRAVEWNYRAMDTAETGYGLQLIGTQYVGELWAGARAESRVFGLIPTFQMTQATAVLPVAAALPEMLFVSESTASNSSNYTTSKTGSNSVTVTPYKFVIHEMFSGEMVEDSIIPFLPFLRAQLQAAVSYYSDSLVLNGDTTNAGTGNINLDDADPADTKHYLAFDGIRHAALVDVTTNAVNVAAALTIDDLSLLRGKMLQTAYNLDWGHPTNPDDLIYVADPETCDAIAMFDELITVDKFGPQATVLSGQQGRILGHPLISSVAVSKTEADGKVSTTGTNNTLGQVVAFNRNGFTVGIKRDLQVETERIIATDQSRIVASLRLGLGRYTPTGAASGIEAAAVAYNITLPS